MKRRTTTVSTPIAHLVGPGKIKIINTRLAYTPVEGETMRLDLNALRTLLCYGDISFTDEALHQLLSHEVEVACLTPHGNRCRGRLVTAETRSAGLRLLQYGAAINPSARLALARLIVVDKLDSQLVVARRIQRRGGDLAPLATTLLQQLRTAAQDAARSVSFDGLRGLEGNAARAWFQLVSLLIEPPFNFTIRIRRPPTDPVNALLSLGYTLTFSRILARIQSAGLEPTLGMLHDLRPGRPSLACDLIESLRAPLVDCWVIDLCNNKKVMPDYFEAKPDGACHLIRERFPHILASWEEHWQRSQGREQLELVLTQFIKRLRTLAPTEPLHTELPGPFPRDPGDED